MPAATPPRDADASAAPGGTLLVVSGALSLLLGCWAVFGLQLLGPLARLEDAAWATALLIGLLGGGMTLTDLLHLRSWRRALPRAATEPLARRWPRVLRKWLGLHATLALLALLYWVLAEYRSALYAPFFQVAGLLLPLFSLLAWPYIAWVDARMAEPHDAYWHLGDALLGGSRVLPRPLLAQHALAWAVKGFFLPLMFGFATRQVLQLAQGPGLLDGPAPDFKRVFDLVFTALYFIDVVWGAVGYLWSLRLTDSHVRSTEPSCLGWVVALACYEPISRGLWPAWFAYDPGRPWGQWLGGQPAAYAAWGTAILLLTGVYTWATMSFGLRFSNLSHRGIVSWGPYRWLRHPAYVAKNLSWWLISMPFMVSGSALTSLRLCAMLLLVNGLYALRAWTEERHLRADPAYRAYAAAVAQRQRALLRALGAPLRGLPSAGPGRRATAAPRA